MPLFPDPVPRSVRTRVVLAWIGFLFLLGFYWLQLYYSHQTQLREAEQQARLRASQTAHALAWQVDTQFRTFDFIVRHLAEHWSGRDQAEFQRVINLALASLPEGALIQVAVADAQGRMLFSSRRLPGESLAKVSIADREHFRVHLQAKQPGLYISRPVKGRLTGEWSVQFTRPILAAGNFNGVIVVSVSVEHLAQAFHKVLPDPEDVVLLVDQQGYYLTRSHGLDQALGTRLPPDREFLMDEVRNTGVYEATAAADGVTRYYAWQRLADYPAVLSLGLGKAKVLSPIHTALRQSHIQNAVGTILLLLLAAWVTRLVLFKVVQNQSLLETRERLRQAVEAVRDGLWTWQVEGGQMHWDERCHEILGYFSGTLPSRYQDWLDVLHPNDREHVSSSLELHAQAGAEQPLALECRMRDPDGAYRWVELRGRIIGHLRGSGTGRFIGTCTDIGNRVAESQLRRALLDQSTAAILLITPQRQIIQASARAQEIFARPGQTLVGQSTRVLYQSDADYEAMQAIYAELPLVKEARLEYPLQDATGATRWFLMHAVPCDPDDPQSNVVWTLLDFSEHHAAEQALELQSLRLTTLLERFPAGVLLEDEADCIVTANRTGCRLLDLAEAPAALAGLPHDQLLERLSPEKKAWLSLPGMGTQKRRMMEVQAGELTLEIDWVPIVRGEERLGHVWLLRDITERKQKELKLATLASTDSLTGLPNRRSFMAALDAKAAEQDGLAPPGALLMLDIDHFKRVNDQYGHPVGDIVLQHVAHVIRHNLRQEDRAGRLGGEEFAVLLQNTTAAESLQLAERLRLSVEGSPAETSAGPIRVTISIGLVEFLGLDGKTALSRADQALYEAKAGGRNQVRVASSG